MKAGGIGLNLTAAYTVIHYDPWWNPAVKDQATDRAHRIGQYKPVFVHRLTTTGTIEEKMEVLEERKQALADGLLGDSTGATFTLTEGDLDILFAPFTAQHRTPLIHFLLQLCNSCSDQVGHRAYYFLLRVSRV